MATDNDQLLGEDLEVKPNPELGDHGSDQEPDYLELLVGDGKKYNDEKNLAKGYANLQAHNQKILEEKQEIQRKLDAIQSQSKTVEDVLAALGKKPSGDNLDSDDLGGQGGGNSNQALSKEDILSIVTSALDQRSEEARKDDQVKRIKETQRETWDKLSGVYGDKAKAKAAVAMYVGDDSEKRKLVQNLGSFDPATLVEMMKAAVPPNGENIDFGLGDDGNQNPQEELPAPKNLFTYAQAEEVRKKNPGLYKSRDFQLRLHKSAAEHPRFWDGIKRRK